MQQRRFVWVVLVPVVVVASLFFLHLSPLSDAPRAAPWTTEAESSSAAPAAQASPTQETAANLVLPSPLPQMPAPAKGTEPAAGSEQELLNDKQSFRRGDTLFGTLISPFVAEAQTRREARARQDPTYSKRIDRTLNDSRVNFMLFGYGETHEPPVTEIAIIGSYTLVSLDTRSGVVDLVSFTHDIRAPEIETLVYKDKKERRAIRMDKAYKVGGFKLMRQVLENATGLSIDFQVAFRDVVIQRLVDNVFGGIAIDNPTTFAVHPFYLDGKKYPQATFAAGRVKLNGTQVIQFIKTVPITQGYYGRTLEHNYRKHLILRALLDTLSAQSADRAFWLRESGFVMAESVQGAIAYDFDPVALAVSNVTSTLPEIGRYVSEGKRGGFGLPQIRRTIYVVDASHGDGGVQWVRSDAHFGNVIAQQDIQSGVYDTLDYEVPIGGNPYGDMVTDYWFSVRTLVKGALLRGEPSPTRDWIPTPSAQ